MRLTQNLETNSGRGKNKQMVYELEVRTHSVTSSILFALLSSSGRMFCYRCVVALGQKVSNELTSSFLSSLRNLQWKLLNYWLRLKVKSVCLIHMFLTGTNNFWKARKMWKMTTAQVIHIHQLPLTALKKCEMWFEKTLGWVFEQWLRWLILRGEVSDEF
jgi:hypothetical protein